jgi:hypothetical protein
MATGTVKWFSDDKGYGRRARRHATSASSPQCDLSGAHSSCLCALHSDVEPQHPQGASADIGTTVPTRLDEEREGELLQNLTFAYLPRGALHSRPLTTACAILSGAASVGLRTEYVVAFEVRRLGFSVCGCV